MITNQDRSGWFGASDTATIMGNWNTATFRDWWAMKCGYDVPHYKSWAMDVGNIMEIPIIRAMEPELGRIRLGRKPVYRRHRLRVNYDGLQWTRVVEIKTTKNHMEKVPKSYWQQCQVLMYALRRRKCILLAYHLEPEDYDAPYFAEIDIGRVTRHTIAYDVEWIRNQYLPRLRYLSMCLCKGLWPRLEDVC